MLNNLFIDKILCTFEQIARDQNHKYTERLAATLRDISKLHDANSLSTEQIACFSRALLSLLSRWGMIDRTELHGIRSKLLEVKLNWLPERNSPKGNYGKGE